MLCKFFFVLSGAIVLIYTAKLVHVRALWPHEMLTHGDYSALVKTSDHGSRVELVHLQLSTRLKGV